MRNLILVFILFAFLTPVKVSAQACPELTTFEKIAQKNYCKKVYSKMAHVFFAKEDFPDDPNGLLNYISSRSMKKEGRDYAKKFVDLVYKADVDDTYYIYAKFASTNCMEGGIFSPPTTVRKNWPKMH